MKLLLSIFLLQGLFTNLVFGQAINMQVTDYVIVSDPTLGNAVQFDIYIQDGPQTAAAEWTGVNYRFHALGIPNNGSVFPYQAGEIFENVDWRVILDPASTQYVNSMTPANFQPGTPAGSKGFNLTITRVSAPLTPPLIPVRIGTVVLRITPGLPPDHILVSRSFGSDDAAGSISSTFWTGTGGDGNPNATRRFIGVIPNAPLPIQLSSFTVSPNVNCSNLVTWETASETGVAGFDLEYSQTGTEFQTIASIPTKGNGNNVNQYSFEHKLVGNNNNQTNYYRLKIVHQGELASEYSKIATGKNNCNPIGNNFSWNVYPNPTNGTTLNVEFTTTNTEMVQFSVLDATGKRVAIYNTVNNGRFDLPIDQLAPGAYFIQYKGTDAIAPQTKKIVKY